MTSDHNNQIESVIGLQMACCFDYFPSYGGFELNEKKVFRFNACMDLKLYQQNNKYFIQFWEYIRKNYENIKEILAPHVPDFKREYVFKRCAFIIAATFRSADIDFLKDMQSALKIEPAIANKIIHEISEQTRFEIEAENFIRHYACYGFDEPTAFLNEVHQNQLSFNGLWNFDK